MQACEAGEGPIRVVEVRRLDVGDRQSEVNLPGLIQPMRDLVVRIDEFVLRQSKATVSDE